MSNHLPKCELSHEPDKLITFVGEIDVLQKVVISCTCHDSNYLIKIVRTNDN